MIAANSMMAAAGSSRESKLIPLNLRVISCIRIFFQMKDLADAQTNL